MSSDLLRALAHELRNSIAPIVNAVHLIRLRGGTDPEMAGTLSIIERQIAAMMRALDAVGEAERLARGDASLQRQRIELGATIRTAVQARTPQIDSRRQRVRIVAARPVWLDADRDRLVRAFGNVIDNASRYSDQGSDITIEMTARDHEADIRIKDNGHGIPADTLPHVFEAFTLRNRNRAGLGLGLTITRAICELHGGRITASSEGTGRGSEFAIRLPLPAQPAERLPSAEAGSEAPAARRTRGARRILVADDNQAVRNSFAAILKEMGHDVRLAADGVQAVELAEAWSPEFVIVDVHMPKIDGYGVARQLRARFPSTVMQLVMMSGTDLDQTTLMGAKQAGFDHCVDKTLAVKGIDALLRGESPPVHA